MQKVLSSKILLGMITLMLSLSFLASSVISVHAQDDVDKDTDTQLEKRKPVRPSSLPTRVKARLDNLRGTDATNQDNDSDNDGNVDESNKNHPKASEARERLQDNREDRQKELQEDRGEKKAEMEEMREKKRAELTDKRKDRIRAYLERILGRFRAAIARLEKLADRIDSRIEKLEEDRGINLSDASALVDEAQRNLEAAETALSNISSKAETAIGEEDPKTAFQKVREVLNEAKENIKSAHRTLVEAIKLVKASVIDSEEIGNDDSDTDTGN
jgi:exonuclease VII small subunit